MCMVRVGQALPYIIHTSADHRQGESDHTDESESAHSHPAGDRLKRQDVETEYWKSQARKFCEFCKCWIADNKVSVSFHENGKRHKESVQKHISQMSKRSAKEFKQKEKMDNDIKKMEKAAMAAYAKDVQNNADITSQDINNFLDEQSKPVVSTAPIKAPPTWHEANDNDGNSYYWNIESNETTWDPPDEYVSIAEQEKKKLEHKEKEKAKEELKKQQQKEAIMEAKAHMMREDMKKRAAKKEKPAPTTSYGPASRPQNPYGSWTPIVTQPQEKIDLELPKVEVFVPPVVMPPEPIRFKERKVESLGEGPVEFKKRKFNNSKRNVRQKTDDD